MLKFSLRGVLRRIGKNPSPSIEERKQQKEVWDRGKKMTDSKAFWSNFPNVWIRNGLGCEELLIITGDRKTISDEIVVEYHKQGVQYLAPAIGERWGVRKSQTGVPW